MPKSRKQIQQEYRQRRDKDVERRQNYLEKEHMKYRQDLASGERKRVIDMDEREARKQRREWKKDNDRAERCNKIEFEQRCVLHHALQVKLVDINLVRRREGGNMLEESEQQHTGE